MKIFGYKLVKEQKERDDIRLQDRLLIRAIRDILSCKGYQQITVCKSHIQGLYQKGQITEHQLTQLELQIWKQLGVIQHG